MQKKLRKLKIKQNSQKKLHLSRKIKERKMFYLDFQLVGERLKALRLESGKKQAEIAKEVGVCERLYSYYETGKRPIPVEVIWNLSRYYGVSMEFIIGQCPNPSAVDDPLVGAAKKALDAAMQLAFYLQLFIR